MLLRLPVSIFFFLSLLVCSKALHAEQLFVVQGRVLSETGEGLPAMVSLKEVRKGTVADMEGNFTLKDLRPGTYHLQVSMLGYRTEQVLLELGGTFTEKLAIVLRESTLDLQEAVIQANPFRNGPIQFSQTVEVLDRSYVERMQAVTFAAALEKLPGLTTINTGVGISKPVIRGLSFNRIMINDRGIKQEGQQWGADHGLEIDPFDVERVEVIKGPGSLIYGSDGMAGVINLLPAAHPEKGILRGDIISSYRTNNDMWSTSAGLEGREGDWVFRGRLTFQDYADYRIPTDRFTYAGFVLPIFDGRLKNTAGRERHFSLSSGVVKKWGESTLTVSRFHQLAGIFPGAVGIPNSFNLQHRGGNRNISLPQQDNTHWKVLHNTRIQLGNNWLEVDLGYQRNLREENSPPHVHGQAPTPEGTLALGLDLDTYTANARFYRHFGRGVQQIFGFQWQRMENQQRGFEFLLPNFTSEQAGFFFFHEQSAREGFTWNAGLRLDFGTHMIQEHLQPIFRRQQPTGEFEQRNADIDRFMGNLSGGTGLSWLIHPDHLLKVNLGSAFRMPTAIELATNGVHHGNFRHEIGNPDLRPERSYQVDVSYAWQRKSFYLALTPFWSFYEGFIYLAPTGRFSTLPASGMMWEYRQHDAVFMGTELKAEWKLHRRWTLSSAFEYVYNYNLDTGLPLPLTPPLSVLNGLRYEAKSNSGAVRQWGGFIEHRISAAQNRVDRNELRTDGFMLLEAGFHVNLRLFQQPIQVQASGQNLLDTFYFNHLSRYRLLNLPEQGRNFILTLKVPIGEKNEKN